MTPMLPLNAWQQVPSKKNDKETAERIALKAKEYIEFIKSVKA